MIGAQDFLLSQTTLTAIPFLPEVKLRLAREPEPVWRATGAWKGEADTSFPFWAFAWPGGQALARYILDHPETVCGLRVLDLAAGCGVGAIAAALAGAKEVQAADIDPLAQAAVQMNAALNGVRVKNVEIFLERPLKKTDIVLAGDVCYEHTMGFRVVKALRQWAASGITVLLADPGRAYAPKEGLKKVARYEVPTSRELEDRDSREVVVWKIEA